MLKIQEDYIRDEDYNNIYSPNPSGTISVRIPESGKDIYASNSFGTAKITIKDKDLINLVDEVRDYSKNIDEAKEFNEYEVDYFETLKNIFYKDVFINELPIELQFTKNNNNDVLNEGIVKMNIVSDNTIIYELNSFDGINYYTVYSAITINNENITLSLLTVMTPKIGEIRSIVFQSLPMIIAVIVLIILIATYYFSRKIIIPISKLANHAEFIKNNNITEVHPIEITGEDEISYLGNTLNDLYSKLNESFKVLEEKNKQLIVENKRQDVFLRASSHQLKTPISAALLLVDGMIDEVGKYKNTKEYLPEVKTQLQSIRKIVDEILNLNNKAVNKKMVDIKELVDEILKEHEIVIRNKSIIVEKQLKSVIKETWYRNKNTTICIVSHYYEELEQLANKILILEKGRVIDFGKKEELFKKYCGKSIIILSNTKENIEITKSFRKIKSPKHLIAISCLNVDEELEVSKLLIENDISFKRSNSDIEIMSINAKLQNQIYSEEGEKVESKIS